MRPATKRRLALDPGRAVWREIEDEVIVLEVQTATYLVLNGSARLLWLLLSTSATRQELTNALVETYAIEVELARADVDSFIGSLEERRLILDRDATSPQEDPFVGTILDGSTPS